ncbi:MAG: hypothetical protein Sapg2KO_11030 [Saprospiraceae bacterium]
MKEFNQENINFELLLDYAEGLLDEPTKARIEARVADDEYYAGVVQGIQFYYQEYGTDRTQLEDYLADFQKRLSAQISQPVKVRKLWSPRLLSIAASVAVVALVGWMAINLLSNTTNPDTLVASALETPYPNVYTQTKGVNEDSVRSIIGDLYVQGEYSQVTQVLPVFLEKTDQTRVEDYFLLGISCLYQSEPNPSLAVTALSKAQTMQPSAALTQQVDWYLAMAHYQNKDTAKAKVIFQKIAQQTDHYRKMQAAELLRSLE